MLRCAGQCFVELEGGGHQQSGVSRADETLASDKLLLMQRNRLGPKYQGIPASLLDVKGRTGIDSSSPRCRHVDMAPFHCWFAIYEDSIEFGISYAERPSRAGHSVFVVGTSRECEVDLAMRERQYSTPKRVEFAHVAFILLTVDRSPKDVYMYISPTKIELTCQRPQQIEETVP